MPRGTPTATAFSKTATRGNGSGATGSCKALNDDLPFDQFTIEQLAGDLLPNATLDQKIASGFNRNHLLNGEGGAIAEGAALRQPLRPRRHDGDDWLGLTVACAQCHDHKYDPITQRDYYSLMDAFNRVPESGTPQRFSARIRVGAPFLELPAEDFKKREEELQAQLKATEKELNDIESQGKSSARSRLRWLAGKLEVDSTDRRFECRNQEARTRPRGQTRRQTTNRLGQGVAQLL